MESGVGMVLLHDMRRVESRGFFYFFGLLGEGEGGGRKVIVKKRRSCRHNGAYAF